MKPKQVAEAQAAGDREALRAMGRKGAKVKHDKDAVRRAIAEEYRTRRLDETERMAEERGDHLIPEEDR